MKFLEQGLTRGKCPIRVTSYRHCCCCYCYVFQLTKILSPPDVHLGIILPQVVEPGLVDHKDSSSYDWRPGGKEKREATHELKRLEAPLHGPSTTVRLPQNPCLQSHWGRVSASPLASVLSVPGPRTESTLRLNSFRSPGD